MKVSTIIPFHGGLQFLHDCLDSLKDQEYQDMEVIIVCDNLIGNIDDLINEFKESLDIKLYHMTDKTGVAAARNIGLLHAVGEYVYFLDSDDYIYENAIEKLVIAAEEEENADVSYGKKKITWFKKAVFLATYHAELESNNEEEDEGDSFENAELSTENGGEFEEEDESNTSENGDLGGESGGESDDDNSNEESDLSEEELEFLEEQRVAKRLNARKNRAIRYMVTKKKGLGTISVLNILMKRSLIEENNIRFHEDLKYYSDLTFLIDVIEHAETFSKDMKALYIKRKHNDSINFPALSQVKDSERFNEYVKGYYESIALVPEDSILRNRLDKKVINYYARLFAPRLRRSLNDIWREERFVTMQKIVSNIDKKTIKKLKGYKKRVIKALISGNLKRSLRIINWHLGVKKFKRITKNRRTFAKFLYVHVFLKLSMKEDWVLCESFFGKSYSDSPKYIYEYIQKNNPGKYKFIWVIGKKGTQIPYAHKKIKRFSIRYAYYLARCKYYVFNCRQPEWVRKREGNILLETWHGTPLKKLVFDQEEVLAASPKYKIQFYKQSRLWDYLIAPNKFSSEIFKRCFMFDKTMLETGYPRNDILHSPRKDELIQEIKAKIGIPEGKKTVLYAPTWRDDEFYGRGQYKFELQLNLKLLKEKLGKDYVILLRTHYFIANSLDITGVEDVTFNLSQYDDISELYLISDILITDYSSVFFDYANLKRPMLFYTYDLDKYRDVLRGFYINIEEELPGPLVFTSEEVVDAIQNIDKITEQYKDKYEVFYDKYCGLEDGHAAEKVAKAVFDLT